MNRPAKLTPMLEQYFEIKRQVPDAILFYRLGDFYEMFFEDAEKAAPLLDLVLTARNKGQEHQTPMCGVPYHSADSYIAKLIRHGLRVAICEQTEDPAMAKGLVKREIVRVVTPGTATESAIVERDSCYLLSLVPNGTSVGAAYLDVSTGDFFVTAYGGATDPRLGDDIARFAPREAIVPAPHPALAGEIPRPAQAGRGWREAPGEGLQLGIPITSVEPSMFETAGAHDYLARHFATQSLRGFGLEVGDLRIGAAGAALRYAAASHKRSLDHVRSLRVDNESDFLQLDAATLANLEVLEPRDSLWTVVNATRSAMGARTLRTWLTRPLKKREAIFDRHDAVDELTRSRAILEPMAQRLASIADLERLAARVTLRSASPRECLTLADSLMAVDDLREVTTPLRGPLLKSIRDGLDGVPAVVGRIATTIADNAPLSAREGGVIKSGVDAELDSLRAIARDSKSILMDIEARERGRTGIHSLKVRFNNVFGYYIEVSKSNLARVPGDYIRKQTLVNAERFITPDLKELEEKITGAEEKSKAIEIRLYEALLEFASQSAAGILATASAVGQIDALCSFASIATRNRYVRATLTEESEIVIEDGRHPVIESIARERFIPNNS